MTLTFIVNTLYAETIFRAQLVKTRPFLRLLPGHLAAAFGCR